ncbi:ATP-binding protein [Myroides odoratimimus]|uniref:sensor histidine kinase n=1 Tax=Myroides odoratimimus TaxID=76832 RepID=UPI002578CD23|nr:ATP-binding protein [Myroides odoratimimus]MDM1457350.1 ATP-binding protein [Myroides odoratimimus]
MKKLRQINFLFVVFALLLVNCNRSKILEGTDYDQLYAVWYSNDYKDSLAETLKPSVKKALSLKNSADNRVFIDSVLNQLRWTRDSISFHKLSERAIRYAKDKSDQYALANVYNNIGMYYHDLGIMDSTYYYYIKAENVYKVLGDSMKIGEMEFYQARLLFEKGLVMESEVKVANALRILERYPLNPIPFEANQLMALCLLERQDYLAAKNYLLTALAMMKKELNKNKILDRGKLSDALMMLYYNLSEVAYFRKDYKEASDYASLGGVYKWAETTPIILSFLEVNVVKSDLMLAVKHNKQIGSKERKQIAIIEDTYTRSLEISNYFAANEMAMSAAELYITIHDSVKAFEWAEKSYQLSKERDIKVAQRTALEFLLSHQEYENKNQVKQIIELNKALEEQDYTTRNRFARIAYETEKVETENNELRNAVFLVVVTSLIIILGLSAGVFIYRLRNKNRELNFITEQKEANESIYQLILEKSTIATEVKQSITNRIAKDLHDGIVNGIFTIRFNLQQLQTENESLKNTLITELENLEKSTRGLSHSLINNELFSETKFISLIEDLTSLQKNQWDTIFNLECSDSDYLEELTAMERVHTYFIIREAIHNVNKYSKASLCTVSFKGGKEGITVRIKDNGIGFDMKAPRGGIGIQNMKERAVALGSELHVFTKINIGTEVIFKVKQTKHR